MKTTKTTTPTVPSLEDVQAELFVTKKTVGLVGSILEANNAVDEEYRCSPYDKDFPDEKCKDNQIVRAAVAVQDALSIAYDETPDFLNGLLIPKYLLTEFYHNLQALCEAAHQLARYEYCETQQFKASGAKMSATLGAILGGMGED